MADSKRIVEELVERYKRVSNKLESLNDNQKADLDERLDFKHLESVNLLERTIDMVVHLVK